MFFSNGYLDSLISAMQNKTTYYLITRKLNGRTWYLYDATFTDQFYQQIEWTTQESKAVKFTSEDDASDIVDDLTPRDVRIVEMEQGII